MASQKPPESHKQENEAFARRTTFHVNINWELGVPVSQRRYAQEQMYVESLEPLEQTQEWPLILIHGDYHSSQVSILEEKRKCLYQVLTTTQIWLSKPDNQPGWASFFLSKGYHVYIVDLPTVGKSNFVRREQMEISNASRAPAAAIEQEFTAPKLRNGGLDPSWPTAHCHDKWPGVRPV